MTSQEFFSKNKYVVLGEVLPKEECNRLTNHMFDLFKQGKLIKDDQCPLSDSIYGDIEFDTLLEKMAKPLGDHIGKKLLPTYTYCRIYRPGEVLKRHKDRPSCQYSGTLTLGFDADHIWPIYFDEHKESMLQLDIGDMAFYSGCDVMHWRPEFKGNWHVQVFFHYVDADGPYADHVYDGRKKLGTDKSQQNFNEIPATNENQQKISVNSFRNPVFGLVGIPSSDKFLPGYFPIFSQNLPEIMFTPEECDKIIEISNKNYAAPATIGGRVEDTNLNRQIRSAEIYAVDNNQENAWIFDKVGKIVSVANGLHFDYDLMGITHSLQLIEYNTDAKNPGHYDWHIDAGDGDVCTRKISLTVQLSDPDTYEGCDLHVLDHSREITAVRERGSVSLFPGYMPHKVDPVRSGKRYALVIWVHGSRRFR